MLLKMGSYDISWSHDSLNKESSEVTELKIGTNVVQITLKALIHSIPPTLSPPMALPQNGWNLIFTIYGLK